VHHISEHDTSEVIEMSNPRLSRRAAVALGTAAAALLTAAIVWNQASGDPPPPDLHGCAVAAERVMTAQYYTITVMQIIGPRPIRACRGLTHAQYAEALSQTYVIEYGPLMSHQPLPRQMPPPSYKALSSR
jgi:hypothetical protein